MTTKKRDQDRANTTGRFAYEGLDRVLHEKARLGMLTSLVANPDGYPTGAILALAPLVKAGLIKPASIIIDSKSGVSGAGRNAAVETSFVEITGAFKAYKIGSHRHTPEIEQGLSIAAGKKISVTFTPHLLPVSRGILTTAYASLTKAVSTTDIHALYSRFYKGEPDRKSVV